MFTMDQNNCPFYQLLGVCRFGDSCSRKHSQPLISKVLILHHLYQHSSMEVAHLKGENLSEQDTKHVYNNYEVFLMDLFKKMRAFGQIQDLFLINNLATHNKGNIYVKYQSEQSCQSALQYCNKQGKIISACFSPIKDLEKAKCKQYLFGKCERGEHCNYLHPRMISQQAKKYMLSNMEGSFGSLSKLNQK